MTVSHDPDPRFDAWVQEAKSADLAEVAASLGARLKRAGHEHIGPCPVCGGDDRFSINTKKGVFNCRGAGGGGVVDMVMHVNGADFVQACEFINQTPPPRGESRPVSESYASEKRDERRDREIAASEQEARDVQKAKTNAERLWQRGVAFEGSYAEAYLHRRGLALMADRTENLRFVRELDYVGWPDPSTDEQKTLGSYPCMIAAIRNVAGEIIGIHRTYLDPSEPQKLIPPGDRARNRAKKVYGKAKGGAIWFGPALEVVALAEGIETTLSWAALGYGGDHIAIAAAVSLGNLTGEATDTVKHPSNGKTVPNGVPDLAAPGIVLPDFVREVIILGDGDSEPVATRMRLLVAVRRFRAQGRLVSVHMAPGGMDWNDVLREGIAQ